MVGTCLNCGRLTGLLLFQKAIFEQAKLTMETSEILNILGEDREQYFNAVSPPIMQTSNFSFKTVADLRTSIRDEFKNPIYTRGNNPAVAILRKKLAALEGTEDALVTSSGSGAIACAVLPQVKSGDHVICVKNAYSWTNTLLVNLLGRFGVETTFVDGSIVENFQQAIKPTTKIIYLESPTSFLFDLQDLQAVAALAKKQNIVTICDNSWSSPLYQQPHKLGVDLVVHSATKYINGHSDIVAGAICGSSKMIEHIFRNEYMTLGPTLSPHDAWLMTRSLRTLEVRMKHVTRSAMAILPRLEKHPKVERIIHPFLESHPQHELAKRQMHAGTGLFSLVLKTNDAGKVEAFCNALKFFLLAVSWGGFESLALPAIALKEGSGLPVNVVRLSLGLEDPEVLLQDLEQALSPV